MQKKLEGGLSERVPIKLNETQAIKKEMARGETIYTMDLTEDDRPHVKVLAAHKLILGLLDSGASVSILGSKGLELLSDNIEIYQDESPVVLKTADDTTHLVSTFADIPFKFNNKEHILKTLVASNITKPLILGMDFWYGFKITCCRVTTYHPLSVQFHWLICKFFQKLLPL